MLGVFLKSLILLGARPSLPELLMTSEFNFTAAKQSSFLVTRVS